MHLIDTNICIYILKQHPAVLTKFKQFNDDVSTSMIVYGELEFGAQKSSNYVSNMLAINRLMEIIPPQPVPIEAAHYYGEIRYYLEAKGEPIGANDLWIAAHSLTLDATLVTNNEKEFSRIKGLKIENWSI